MFVFSPFTFTEFSLNITIEGILWGIAKKLDGVFDTKTLQLIVTLRII